MCLSVLPTMQSFDYKNEVISMTFQESFRKDSVSVALTLGLGENVCHFTLNITLHINIRLNKISRLKLILLKQI